MLGGLRIAVDGRQISLTGARQRALLMRLLLARNQIVSGERLVDDLYPGSRSGQKALQVGIARLRRTLGAQAGERVLTRDAGYELATRPGELDLERFESQLTRGLALLQIDDAAGARDAASGGLAMWRGAPLGELAEEPWARGESARLQELHLQAHELQADAELDLGAADAAVARLEALVTLHPAREGLHERLMLALYRTGRQAEALAAYRELRSHLVESHGIEPSRELRELQRAILLQDASLGDQRPGAAQRHPPSAATAADAGTGALPATEMLAATPAAAVAPLTAPARLIGEGAAPFVGRAAELAALSSAIETCAQGTRAAALISGEPGIGKTRLAGQVAILAAEHGFDVLIGRCDDDLAIPFKPFVEALESLLAGGLDAGLQAHLREHRAVLAHLLPAHRRDPGETRSADPESRHWQERREAPSEGLQYALFAAVAALLLEASRRRPLLMILEDLHWADRPTMLLIKHLLASPAKPRLMVLGTYRSSELRPEHPLKDLLADLHREGSVARLELVGLLDGEVGELVGGLSAGHRTLSPRAARALRRSTAGNPFLVTEVTRALMDSGAAALGALGEDDPAAEGTLPLPLSVRETVGQRVERLPGDAASFLAAASVLGVAFDPELLGPLLQRPRADALSALEAALAAALLEEGGGQMSFRHALIAQTIYETLSAARRRELHGRAAELMAARAETARSHAGPAAIARQYLRAGPDAESGRAIEWARRAAADALAKLAPQEAQRWYQEALTLTDRGAAEDGRMRCELLAELGEAQRQSGDPASRETLLEAARLAGALHDDEVLVRAALANTRGFVSGTGGVDDERIAVLEHALALVGPARSPVRARLLATLAGELSYAGDFERRSALSDEALAIAREDGERQTLVHVIGPRNVTIWCPATLAERHRNTAECLRAADMLDDPLAQFQAVHWRASTCVETGAFAEAAMCRRRARGLAEHLRQPTALWMARYDSANEALIAGRLSESERLANEAFAIGQASGQPDALLILGSQLMVIRYEQGRLGECIELVTQSLEQNPRIPGFRAVLALAYCEERRYEDAAASLLCDARDGFGTLAYDLTWLSVVCAYAQVAARLTAAGTPHPEISEQLRDLLTPWQAQIAYTGAGAWGLVACYLGQALLATGDAQGAARVLEGAVSRAERLPAPVWAARCGLELARALRACRRHAEAQALLTRVRRDAASLECAGIAREAEELLGGDAPAPQPSAR